MNITIKQLTGPEMTINICGDSLVSEVKNILEQKWKIPNNQQRLVFKGKTLEDNNKLNLYGLHDGGKIFLSVKKDVETSNTLPSSGTSNLYPQLLLQDVMKAAAESNLLQGITSKSNLWTELETLLKKHYKEEDALKILEHYKMLFRTSVASLSLDDIERLATSGMEREKTAHKT